MNIFDWSVGGYRLPLAEISEENKEKLLKTIGDMKK